MKKYFLFMVVSLLSTLPAYSEWKYMGDANNSGNIDQEDLSILTSIILEKQTPPKDITLLDMNGDKKLSIADIIILIEVLNGQKDKTEVWIPETVPVDGGGGFD